jgi:hypothetical protein
MTHSSVVAVVLLSGLAIAACQGTLGDSTASSAGGGASTTTTASAATSGATTSASTGTSATTTASASSGTGGAGPVDPCGSALFCEKFDDYAGVDALADGQKFGPWHAALKSPGAVMDLDGTHTTSGTRALHMHIDTSVTAGGRLFADSAAEPLFQGHPTHVYGRMMMYIDPNGPSIHWTFFGVSGDADPSSPAAGRRATYLMSSLPKNNVNTYSFVYGLNGQGADPYHDCYFQSAGAMPTAKWTCVSFELDSLARKLRMSENGASAPTASVDDHGQGCVGNVVPQDSPWYGPAIDQLYVGAWSFHDMVSPLDVWIDDLVVDTKPLACPAP